MEHTFGSLDVPRARAEVEACLAAFDGQRMREALLECFLIGGVDHTVADVMVPTLREVGERWESGEIGVAHEHFVSHTLTTVLGELRLPEEGEPSRRTVVLACPPGELHVLPVLMFGAMLEVRGWRTVVLGANTPWTALSHASRLTGAEACVLAAVRPRAFTSRGAALTRLAARLPVYVAGPATADLDAAPGVAVLPDDWRLAADLVGQDDAERTA